MKWVNFTVQEYEWDINMNTKARLQTDAFFGGFFFYDQFQTHSTGKMEWVRKKSYFIPLVTPSYIIQNMFQSI